MFLVPWPGYWLIGTTDPPYDGPIDRPTAGGRRGRRDPGGGEPDARRRPHPGRPRRHVRGAAAAHRARRRRLDPPRVARAPGPGRAGRPHPDRRRQVHDLSGHGPRCRGCRARRRLRGRDPRRPGPGIARARPSRTEELPLIGAAGRPALDALVDTLTGRFAASGGPRRRHAARLVARHGTQATDVVAPRRAARPAPPLGRGRSTIWRPRSPGPSARSSRSASPTSSSAGPASPRSCPIAGRRSRRGSPRSSARSSAGPGAPDRRTTASFLERAHHDFDVPPRRRLTGCMKVLGFGVRAPTTTLNGTGVPSAGGWSSGTAHFRGDNWNHPCTQNGRSRVHSVERLRLRGEAHPVERLRLLREVPRERGDPR